MDYLPTNWKKLRLSKILKIKHGKNQKQVECDDGKYPILGSGGLMGYANDYLWDKPSVLIGRKGTINKPQFMDKPFWTVDTLFYTDIFKGYEPKWLYNVFQTINWYKYNEASGVPSLSASTIETIRIMVPPFEEQKKIANILTTWDRAIEINQEAIIYRKSLLSGLTKGLTKGYKKIEGFQESIWKNISLDEVFIVRNEKKYASEELPLYSFTIEDGVTPKSDRYNRDFLVKGKKKYKVSKYQDLVFNPANLKYGAIAVNDNKEDVLISPIYETLVIKDTNKYDIDFFKYLLTHSEMIGFYKSKVEGTLIERSAVKVDAFLLFQFDVPSIEEQRKISKILKTIDKSINLMQKEVELLKLQKKGLMQQLLTGKIRVQS